ncbi:MAG: hypothetical protein Q9220_003962 [cf. Caloplaca sp. 1 TL-2023]
MAALLNPASRTILRLPAAPQRPAQALLLPTVKNYHGTAYHWSVHAKSPRDHKSTRPFHESEKLQNRFDASSIDFAYMPQHTLEESVPPQVMRIPLLPHNTSPPPGTSGHEDAVESVVRPEISLVSANSTHIESPSAMSEVTDNHALDLNPFELTSQVTAAAAKMAEAPMEKLRDAGTVRELWGGLLDDLFGSRPMSKA